MKKFLMYILGVLSWLNATACFAVDKFEVLPDLPDPLAYAVQPAEAASVSGTADVAALGAQSIGNEPSIISVVLSLAFVVLLIYVTGIIYAKLNRVNFNTLKRQNADLTASHVTVVSTTPLGNNKTLHVVELDGKRMLIGASSGAIQLIKDLGNVKTGEFEEEFSHIEIPNIKIPKIEIPKIEIPTIGFSKLMTKTHKGIEFVEKGEIAEERVVEKELSEEFENDNSEVIIDSLFSQTDDSEQDYMSEDNSTSEHTVDPDDFVLYKKYLG